MLRTRVIATLTLLDGRVVQSHGFRRYLPIGRLDVAIDFLNQWGADEIMLVDLTSSRAGNGPNLDVITPALNKCFVPVSVAGGIRSVEDARALVHSGAEKVCLQKAALADPDLVTKIAEELGSQAVVVAVDHMRRNDGGYDVVAENARTVTGLDSIAWLQEMECRGAGEILLTAADRDGSGSGYDLDMIRRAAESVSIPIIAKGGAAHPDHMVKAIEAGASAVAAGNMFLHSEHSIVVAKAQLADTLPIRRDGVAKYDQTSFTEDGRIAGRHIPLRPTCNYQGP